MHILALIIADTMAESDQTISHDRLIESLISQHRVAIGSYLRAILPGVRDVEDILQDVTIVIWDKRETFREGTNFKAWAFSIARFTAMNAQGKFKRNAWLVFNDSALDLFSKDFEEAEQIFDPKKVALSHCLSKMRGADLNILRQRYISKVTLEEAAARIGRSAVALRVRLHKLRIQLRHCIETHLKEHPPE